MKYQFKILILICLVGFYSPLIGQESRIDAKIEINEVFIHKKNPVKNWVELKCSANNSTRLISDYYLSKSVRDKNQWPIKMNWNKVLKIKSKKPKYVTIKYTKGFLPFSINTNAYTKYKPFDFKTGNKIYLFESNSNQPLDSFSIGKTDSSRYSSQIKNPTRRKDSKLTYAVTKKEKNLTLANSYVKKSAFASIGYGIGNGKFRTIENEYNTSWNRAWNIGFIRERQTRLKFVKLQYGLLYSHVKFAFDGSNSDTLSKFVNGVERITFRDNNTIGWRKNSRWSIPLLLQARLSNHLAVTTGM